MLHVSAELLAQVEKEVKDHLGTHCLDEGGTFSQLMGMVRVPQFLFTKLLEVLTGEWAANPESNDVSRLNCCLHVL